MRVPFIPQVLLAFALAACGGRGPGSADTVRANKLGAITGMVRDRTSGEYIAQADIDIGTRRTKSDANGVYLIDDVSPGTYTLHAQYAGQPVTVNKIDVGRGEASYVDVWFTLGEPSPIVIDWGDPREGEIVYFAAQVSRIEGTVGDQTTRARVEGAVVTAARGRDYETLQTVTDEQGRYRFDAVDPGTYAISAYYSIGGRGQIEVRRSDITVTVGQGALVPLWIELAGQ